MSFAWMVIFTVANPFGQWMKLWCQNNNNWLLDPGATHNSTSDLDNLSLHSNYVSDEHVIENGNRVLISQTRLFTFNFSIFKFVLNNVLCTPLIKKNLISVSQFCTQNSTSIESILHCFSFAGFDYEGTVVVTITYTSGCRISTSHFVVAVLLQLLFPQQSSIIDIYFQYFKRKS